MILESVFGLSLVLNVSLESQIPAAGRGIAWGQPTVIERQAELLPAIARATDCILRRIADDPRYRAALRPGEISDLIANSLRGSVTCTKAATTISAYGTPTAAPSSPYRAGDTAPAPIVPV